MLNRELDIFCTNYSSFSYTLRKPRGPHKGWFQFSERNGRNTNVNVNRLKRKYEEMNGIAYLPAPPAPRGPPVVLPPAPRRPPVVLPPAVVVKTGPPPASRSPVRKKRKFIASTLAVKWATSFKSWFERLFDFLKEFAKTLLKKLKAFTPITDKKKVAEITTLFKNQKFIKVTSSNDLQFKKSDLSPLTWLQTLQRKNFNFNNVYINYSTIKGDKTFDVVEFNKVQNFSKIIQNLYDPEFYFELLEQQTDQQIFNKIFNVRNEKKGDAEIFKYALTLFKNEIKKDSNNYILKDGRDLLYYARLNAILALLQKSKNKLNWDNVEKATVDSKTKERVNDWIVVLTKRFNTEEINNKHNELIEEMFAIDEPLIKKEGVEETKEKETLNLEIETIEIPDLIVDDVNKLIEALKIYTIELYEKTADENSFKNLENKMFEVFEDDEDNLIDFQIFLKNLYDLFKDKSININELNKGLNEILNAYQERIVINLKKIIKEKQLKSIRSFDPNNLDLVDTFTKNNMNVFQETQKLQFYTIWTKISNFERKILDNKKQLYFVELDEILNDDKINKLKNFEKSVIEQKEQISQDLDKQISSFSQLTKEILKKQIQDKLETVLENCSTIIKATFETIEELKRLYFNYNFEDLTLDARLQLISKLQDEKTLVSKNVFTEIVDYLTNEYKIFQEELKLEKEVEDLISNLEDKEIENAYLSEEVALNINELQFFKFLVKFVNFKNEKPNKKYTNTVLMNAVKNIYEKKLQKFENNFKTFYYDEEVTETIKNNLAKIYNDYKEDTSTIDLFDRSIEILNTIEDLKNKKNYKELAKETETNDNTIIGDSFIKQLNAFAKTKLKEAQIQKEKEEADRQRRAREEAKKLEKAREEAEKKQAKIKEFDTLKQNIIKSLEIKDIDTNSFIQFRKNALKELDRIDNITSLKDLKERIEERLLKEEQRKARAMSQRKAREEEQRKAREDAERKAREEAKKKIKQYKENITNVKNNYKKIYDNFKLNLKVLETIEKGLKIKTLKKSEANKALLKNDVKNRINFLKSKLKKDDLDIKKINNLNKLVDVLIPLERERANQMNVAATDIQKVTKGRMTRKKKLIEAKREEKRNAELKLMGLEDKFSKTREKIERKEETKKKRDKKQRLKNKRFEIDELINILQKFLNETQLQSTKSKITKIINKYKPKVEVDGNIKFKYNYEGNIRNDYDKVLNLIKDERLEKQRKEKNKLLEQINILRNREKYTTEFIRANKVATEILKIKDNKISQETIDNITVEQFKNIINQMTIILKEDQQMTQIRNNIKNFIKEKQINNKILKKFRKYFKQKYKSKELLEEITDMLNYVNDVYLRKSKKLSKSDRNLKFLQIVENFLYNNGNIIDDIKRNIKQDEALKTAKRKNGELEKKKSIESNSKRLFKDQITRINTDTLRSLKNKFSLKEYNFLAKYLQSSNLKEREYYIDNFNLGPSVDLPFYELTMKLQEVLKELFEPTTILNTKTQSRTAFAPRDETLDEDLMDVIPTIPEKNVLKDEKPDKLLETREDKNKGFDDTSMKVEEL